MTDHDDTPSTEEEQRVARFQLSNEETGTHCANYSQRLVGERVRANRLAARVASLSEQLEQTRVQLAGCGCEALGYASDCNPGDYGWSESLGDVRRLRTELAKLRAAAAPVELPEGWRDGTHWSHTHRTAYGPGNATVELWPDGDVYVHGTKEDPNDMGETAPASVLRHLLALPPQEDARGALPDGWASQAAVDRQREKFDRDAHLSRLRLALQDARDFVLACTTDEHGDGDPELPEYDARVLATIDASLAEPAPRTEGGGRMTAKQRVYEVAVELFGEGVGCSDHGCVFGHPGGMGTNGGCQHLKEREYAPLRRMVQQLAAVARRLAEGGGDHGE